MKRTRHIIEIGRDKSITDIKKVIQGDSALAVLLVGDVSSHDMRATFTDGSFRVEDITKDKGIGMYTLDYCYDWDAYYGCRDMCRSDTEYDATSFRYWCGRLIFVIEFHEQECRSTDEEF